MLTLHPAKEKFESRSIDFLRYFIIGSAEIRLRVVPMAGDAGLFCLPEGFSCSRY
jgi:hypothetical protein